MYSRGHWEESSSHLMQKSLCVLSPYIVCVLCAVLASQTNIFLFCRIWRPACISGHWLKGSGPILKPHSLWEQAIPRTHHTCQKGCFPFFPGAAEAHSHHLLWGLRYILQRLRSFLKKVCFYESLWLLLTIYF